MIKRCIGLLLLLIWRSPVLAQPVETLTIGYVEVAGDQRYVPMRATEGMVLMTRERPFPAAEVAVGDAKPLRAILHRDVALSRIAAANPDAVIPAVQAALANGTRVFVLDLPASSLSAVADAVKGQDVLLVNATAQEDALRRQTCAAHLVHVAPSTAMLMDAQAQYLVFRKWRDVLVLRGPRAGDQILADAFLRSAKKFGARIVADLPFRTGTDPREREMNDIALLTASTRDYDAVFVADTDPDLEFARSLPYRTTRPRPVIGAAGLVASAWDATWEHYGAPQLTNRLAARAGRLPSSADWTAWMAVKLVVTAVQRTKSIDVGTMKARILSDPSFDGVKGLAVSVRPWDHQLRQAVLLTTRDSVVASAPLPGFLHATNELDTVGDDRAETPCHLDGN